MTTDELIAYYQSLLIIQFNDKPKAQGTVAAMVRAILADQIIATVRDGFNVDTAIGAQLDILGEYRGVSRLVFGLNPARVYFSMPAYADGDIGTVKGFADYTFSSNTVTWYFLQYSDVNQLTYTLTDDEMRRLIKFNAAVQSSDFSYKALDAILFTFFGTNVNLVDNQNMTITYVHNPADTDLLFTVVNQSGNLPQPAGVTVSVA